MDDKQKKQTDDDDKKNDEKSPQGDANQDFDQNQHIKGELPTQDNTLKDVIKVYNPKQGVQLNNATPIGFEELSKRLESLSSQSSGEQPTIVNNNNFLPFEVTCQEIVDVSKIETWAQRSSAQAFFKKFPQLKLVNRFSGIELGPLPDTSQLVFAKNALFNNKVSLYLGDITRVHVDAIVNAASRTASGGGGLDGLVWQRAGYGLLEELKDQQGTWDFGEVYITKGHRIPCKYIFHTVGPTLSMSRSFSQSLAEEKSQTTITFDRDAHDDHPENNQQSEVKTNANQNQNAENQNTNQSHNEKVLPHSNFKTPMASQPADQLLAMCYSRCLEVLENPSSANTKIKKLDPIQSLAFPCISTGNHQFDPVEAARIALSEVRRFLDRLWQKDQRLVHDLKRIVLVVHTVRDEIIYDHFLPAFFPE